MISEIDPQLRVQILTGRAKQKGIKGSLSTAYAEAWKRLCDHTPPGTEIRVVGKVVGGEAPFHDRWIISNGGGLRLGTSFNGFGRKMSEISVLGSQEIKDIKAIVEGYRNKTVRIIDGERIGYESFDLWT